MKRGADVVVETLVGAGVRQIFTLSGNHILSLYDAAVGHDLTLLHTRHEAAAVHMADGWGRLTERPGIALVTAGPGHANALGALYTALHAEAPMVLLSGHCSRDEIGGGGFQEMAQVEMARPVTKAAWLCDAPERLAQDVMTALALAARSGSPGPVHLSLPGDVLAAAATGRTPHPAAEAEPRPRLGEEAVQAILNGLADAARPLVLVGPAMARAHRWEGVEALSRLTGVPALSIESPRGVNDPWLRGATSALAEADFVLLLGKALDYSLRFGAAPAFAERCRFVQVATGAPLPAKASRVGLAVSVDAHVAAQQLLTAARARTWRHSRWTDEVPARRRAMPPGWTSLRGSSETPIHPLRVCTALERWVEAGGLLVCDGGEFGQWVQAGVEPRERLINGLAGSIGSGLPMAVAAKLACPERPVFVALGDGTFGFHAFELDTALRHRLPVVAVIGNDARWNAEHQLQLRDYGPDRAVACELLPARYDRVAEALGGYGELVERADQLDGALARAVAARRPAVVNVLIASVAAPTFR